jgi:outer membrane receptor protein involved in Fe transport
MQERRGTRTGATLLMVLALWVPALALAAPREFDIPTGPANQTLTRFAQQAEIAIVFPYDLAAGHVTRGVRGKLEPDEALRRMLLRTGLVAQRDGKGQLVIALSPGRRSIDAAGDVQGDPELADTPADLDEINVTGSRIQRDGMTSPTPVTVLTPDELRALSAGTLADAVVELPHFLNSDTPQSQSFATSGAAGASYLNLRGIGAIRTLTLLDGRRLVPSTRFGILDLALVPRALVQRVEVVTGGASAAYGSDAVSGVVNLLTDSSFNGLRARMQGGVSDRGDNGNAEISFTYGSGLGDQSHLLLLAEYTRNGGIRGYRHRDWFAGWATIPNPDPAGPARVTVRDVHATGYTYGGLITSGPLAGTQFLHGGVPAPFLRGDYYTGRGTQSGGDGIDPAADLVWMLPDQWRTNAYLKFDTQISPDFSAYLQLLAGRSSNSFEKDPPSLWGTWEATIYSDNAFLPASIRAQMRTLGVNSFRLGRMGNGDLGSGRVHNSNDLLSATIGGRRQLGDWRLDSYYQYGRNRNLLRYDDTLRIDRIYRGIDSVVNPRSGEIVCRSTLFFPADGCVPVNIFGAGSVAPLARRYITEGRAEQVQDVTEQVAEFTTQGSLFQLPAGSVSIATGINWRREAVDNTPRRLPASLQSLTVPPAFTQGYRGLPSAYVGSGIFERTVYNNFDGRYAVWELFGEAAVPLLADQPLFQKLTLHTALRYAHYSGSGTVAAWKGGLDWTLNDQLRLRATRSRDVRAGSLAERFDISSAGTVITDPALAGQPSYAVVATRIGNPNVDPETTATWTAGLVYKPQPVQGLSISADYYDIRIGNAISVLGVQNIINRCHAGKLQSCALIARSFTDGRILAVNDLVHNVAGYRSRGVDLEVSLRRRATLFGGDESVAFRLFANRTLEMSETAVTGIKVDRSDQTGIVGGAPAWQVNASLAYRRDSMQLMLQERVISSGRYGAMLNAGDIDNNHVAGRAYTNLRGSWGPRQLPGFTVYAQASNLFDRNPPRAASWTFIGSAPTNESLFDVIGRRYVVGFTYELQ